MKANQSERKIRRNNHTDGVADRVIILAVAFAIIPIAAMLNTFLNVIINGVVFPRWGNRPGGVASLIEFFEHTGYTVYMKNSIILCVLSIALGLTLAVPAAYSLSRYKFKGLNMFGIMVVVPLLIPTISYFLPFAVTMKRVQDIVGIKIYNSYNGYIILAIMYAIMYLPFSIWVLRGFMISIPAEIEEAARVDGCSTFSVFTRVLLPLMRSGIVVTAMLLLMLVWDERLLVDVLMTEERFRTVALWPSFNMQFIAGPLSSIPIFLVFFFIQKNFMRGITGGALKE